MFVLLTIQITVSSPGRTNTAGCWYHFVNNYLLPFGKKIKRAQKSVPEKDYSQYPFPQFSEHLCVTVQAVRHQATETLATKQYNSSYMFTYIQGALHFRGRLGSVQQLWSLTAWIACVL